MSFHIRRKEREIADPTELRQILKATKYVTVALCLGDKPYLVALSHGYDEAQNCIYFHCAGEGKKIVYAKANPNVWGEAILDFVVDEDCRYSYTSVHFSGKISFITDITEKHHAMEVLVRQVSLKPEEKLKKIMPERLEKITMGRIDIDYMSGKKRQSPKIQS